MKTKTFVEENKTVEIILNDDDNVIVVIHNYEKGYEQVSVNLMYYTFDYYYVIDLYKNDMITL